MSWLWDGQHLLRYEEILAVEDFLTIIWHWREYFICNFLDKIDV